MATARKPAAKKAPIAEAIERSAPARKPAAKKPAGKPASPSRPASTRSKYSRPGIALATAVRVFGELYVKHQKGEFRGMPFVLDEWQWQDIILPIYATLNRHRKRKHRFALIGLPRWNGKSEITALMVLYHLFVERVFSGECYVVASTEKQAMLVFNTVKRMIKASPQLAAACDIYAKEIIVKETGCIFRCLPHDADTAQGYHPSLCIIDEVHVHKKSDLIEAMVSGSVGHAEGLVVCITTAGPKREGVLWDLIKAWTSNPFAYVHWVGAPDGADPHDPKVWRAANPAKWITDEMLRIQYETLPIWSFERYHLNRFPSGVGGIQAFPVQMWEKNGGVPEIDPALPVVIGVDSAPRRDRCSITVAQRHADGTHHWQTFIFDPGRTLEYDDLTQVEDQIRLLCGEFYVIRIVCDPAFMWLILNRLKAEGFPVETMRQDNAHMCGVAGMLYKLLSGGLINHGNDPDMTDDAMNAAVLERPPYGWRIGKLDDDRHIDSVISAGMASFVLEAEFGDMYSGPPVIVG